MSTLRESGEKIVNNLIDVIVEPMVLLMIFISTAYFFWGLAVFVMNPEDQTTREEGKKRIIWGLVGFFVMFSVWGIINFSVDTLAKIIS